MSRKIAFSAYEPAFLRSAAIPAGAFSEILSKFGKEGPADEEALLGFIAELSSDPILREAISVSSADLSGELDRIAEGARPHRKSLLRTALSMMRYARRITVRPTPFGLFAGVSTLPPLPDGGPTAKSVRPDAGWFDGLAAQWIAVPHVRHSLRVVANNLSFVRGDRLVLPHHRARGDAAADITGTQQATEELSVRYTPVLAWVRSRAARPVLYLELLDAAEVAFPRLGRQRLDSFLSTLAQHEVLLTEFATTSLEDRSLAALEHALPESAPEREQLAAVRSALAVYRNTAVGSGGGAYRQLVQVCAAVHPSKTAAPQVDLRTDRDVDLPAAVLREVEGYAAAMWSMSAPSEAFAHMRSYRRAFLDTYGQHGAVRLEELVDPHRGLGFPATYLHPRTSTNFPSGQRPKQPAADEARVRALADLIQRGLSSDAREVVLTDDDIRRLTVDDGTPPPASLELCFQLLSRGRGELADGDFTLVTTPTTGTLTAGAMAGRFAELTGARDGVGRLLSGDDPALPAQVDFVPVLPRALNVMQVPRLLPHTIAVGTFTDPAEDGCIDWRDLVVAADGYRLRLYWEKTGQEVRPVLPHVLSLGTAAPNLVRFLGELGHCGEEKIWQAWNWGPFEHLPVLPRVRLGRVVVSPLSWRPSAELRESAEDGGNWQGAVDTWRRELDVPDRVTVGHRDQVSELDLSNAFQREALRREIRRDGVTITESPCADPDAYGWLGGHANEILVPVRRTERGTSSAHPLDPQRIANSALRPSHSPGGPWAFVEIHALPEVHEELITRHLPAVVRHGGAAVDRWFFMRYRQSGDHIRFRVRGRAEPMADTVWPFLLGLCADLRSSGLIKGARVCAYEPEYARYGGVEGVARAEEWFTADSLAAVGLLTAFSGRGTDVSKEHALTAGYVHLLESLGPWDWHAWVDHLAPRNAGAALPRAQIRAAAELMHPGRSRELLTTLMPEPFRPAIDQIASSAGRFGDLVLPGLGRDGGRCWQDAAVASLLHMHHNRLYGIDPAGEATSLALLAQAARTHRARLAHHPAPQRSHA
ncbi:lantibiotic dehydratase [Kitasatospora cineracea]|uniref:lantibiotic dehydratase n=1 Tax=Kitasatospora cineracea TaxID=88074 RepID=UPI003799F067